MNKQDKNNNFFLQQGKMTEKAKIIKILEDETILSNDYAKLIKNIIEQIKEIK